MEGVFENDDRMWFGTRDRMQWVETPRSGAEASVSGMSASADLIDGGAFVRNSADGHKTYSFSWGESADRTLASIIRSYRNGSYGRGLIYFWDPMFYDTNGLPQRWADPSMAINFEAPDLTGTRYQPSDSVTAPNVHGLPVRSAFYSFPVNSNLDGLRDGDALFLPIPPGMELVVFAYYSQTGSAFIRVRHNGVTANTTDLARNGVGSSAPTMTVLTGGAEGGYAELYLATAATGVASTLQIAGITARLRPIGSLLASDPFWYTGEGHSGCRFDGNVKLFNNNGVGGGQVSLSCELKEVGSWE